MARTGKRRWPMILVIVLAVLAAATYGAWRWAVAQGSAATLEWIDARFSRSIPVRMVAHGDYGANDHQNVELWAPQGHAPAGGWPLVCRRHQRRADRENADARLQRPGA